MKVLQEKVTKEEKLKKKLYDPFVNDIDYYSVDENLPVEIKSRIPHWVPCKNSDIFEVRKVMTSEKEHLRNLNRSIGVYKINNEILLSKSIIDEETKRFNKRINRDISNKIINEEKNLNKNIRNYITENRYNEMNKYKQKMLKNKSPFLKHDKNLIQTNLTETDINSRLNKSGEFSYNIINTDLNTHRSVNNKKIDRNELVNNSSPSNVKNKLENNIKNSKKNLSTINEENNDNKKSKIIVKTKNKEKENLPPLKEKIETEVQSSNKANNSLLITSIANETSSNVDQHFKSEIIKNYKKKFDTSVLHELKEEKEEMEKKETDDSTPNKKPVKEQKLSNSVAFEPPITSILRYSVRDYINKTREIVLLRHSVEIKKETALKIEENYHNQIESVKESIKSLHQAKELFEDDFFVKFDRYVKYLRVQREKEINEMNNLVEIKGKNELEIQKLEARKNKSKDILNLYREYRNFLICVREKTLKLPKFFIENENFKNNIVINLKLRNSKILKIQKNLSIMQNENMNSNLNISGDISDIDSDLDEEEKIRILIQKEKRMNARNKLLNQLQGSSSSDILSNKNPSPTFTNKNSKININNSMTSNNNLRNSNNNFSNSNSKDNTFSNDPTKNSLVNNNLSPKKINKNQSTKWSKASSLANLNNNNNNSNTSNFNVYNLNNLNNSNYKTENLDKNVFDASLEGIDSKSIDKFNKYISKPIYETPDDLNEDIKKLQTENINLLKVLSSTSSKVNIIKQELQKKIKQDNSEYGLLVSEVEQRIDNFKKIQEINKNLIEDKNFILGGINSQNTRAKNGNFNDSDFGFKKSSMKKSLIKSKFNQAILYSKTREIFNLVMDMKINSKLNQDINYKSIGNIIKGNNMNTSTNKISMNLMNLTNSSIGIDGKKNNQIDKDSNMMYMLKIIEKSIDFLVAKQQNFMKDPKKVVLLEKIKIDLEKDRKITKAIESRLKDEKRREILNVAIIERNNRPIILPKKKFGERVRPIEEKIKNIKLNKTYVESNIQELNIN